MHRSIRFSYERGLVLDPDLGFCCSPRNGRSCKRRTRNSARVSFVKASAGSGTATSSDGFDGGRGESQRARDRRMSRVEELASTEIGFKDSEGLKPFHLAIFVLVLSAGLWFLAVLLYFTADIKLQQACLKVLRRLLKTVALRQVMGILAAMTFVRFGLEPLVKMLRKLFVAPGAWEKSSEYYILKELYSPLEFLFSIAAVTTLAENFLPQLIALPKGMVQNFVRSTLSLTFVIAAARVVFNIKARMTRETTWSLELKGELTKQRRVEAVDKLLTVLTLLVASVFGLQAIGLDVNSVLAIGGVGGLAVGLAGREILENLFTGLIILSSSPFEVGDEVMFAPPTGPPVEGIVVDVGWYRTTIRSFEREIFNIPNSVFSRNVVLNVTRKQREWRFFNFLGIRLQDMPKVNMVIADMRKLIRQDQRIIHRLHRRVFLDKVDRDQITIYISFYVEAANRDAFMSVKQDLILAFVECIDRNGAHLAKNRLQLEWTSRLESDSMPRRQAGVKVPNERQENEVPASLRALPEAGEGPENKAASSGSGTPGDSSSTPQTPQRERQMAVTSSNVVPKESVVRAAISIAAAGSLSAEDTRGAQQGQWVTASFDDLPDR